jgi:cytidine deaminase
MDKCIKKQYSKLYELANSARGGSYSPYSGFSVGAALLCKNGKIYTGMNIENSSFTPTVCAERVAFFRAIAEGEREFCAIAIAGGKSGEEPNKSVAPCGVCRQVMGEFCTGDFQIYVAGKDGDYESYTLAQLLPHGFSAEEHMKE